MLKSSLMFCRPGSLKRGLASQCPDDCLNKRSRTSSMSSLNNTYTSGIPSSLRNAIASSYSSSRGLTQVGSTPEGTTAAMCGTKQLYHWVTQTWHQLWGEEVSLSDKIWGKGRR